MSAYQTKIFKILVLTILLSSCASYHNLNEDGANHLGGGFIDMQLAPGFYSLIVKTNFAPWKNFSGAWSTWNTRAKELCEQQDFQNIEVQESSYNTVAGKGYVVSQLKGYVICSGANLEKNEIEGLIFNNRQSL